LSNASDLGRYESSADEKSESSHESKDKSKNMKSSHGPMSSSEQSKADYALAMTKHLIESELESSEPNTRALSLLKEPNSSK
jgi:hypothetical protein